MSKSLQDQVLTLPQKEWVVLMIIYKMALNRGSPGLDLHLKCFGDGLDAHSVNNSRYLLLCQQGLSLLDLFTLYAFLCAHSGIIQILHDKPVQNCITVCVPKVRRLSF